MSNGDKTKLFSVTIADCEIQTFRSGGKGGQNQNKVESGVRIIHHPSGARGEGREERSQLANKRRAFERMAQTKEFQRWAKSTAAKLSGQKSVEEIVDEMMQPHNLKVEVRNEQGLWEEARDE